MGTWGRVHAISSRAMQPAFPGDRHQPDHRLAVAGDDHFALERLLDQPRELALRLQHVDLHDHSDSSLALLDGADSLRLNTSLA
jgi:hypothetical protein